MIQNIKIFIYDPNMITLGKLMVYDHKTVVGVPRNKYALGLDIYTKPGFYLLILIIIWEMYMPILIIQSCKRALDYLNSN
jgi:hypothetical protein